MSFFNIFSGKKNKKQNDKNNVVSYDNPLEELLVNNKIEYVNEDDYIVYRNFANRPLLKFYYEDNKLYLKNKEIELDDAFNLIKKEWKKDKLIIPFLNNEDYIDFFELEEFCYEFCKNILMKELAIANSKTLKLFFQFGENVSEHDYCVCIECYGKRDGVSLFRINPNASGYVNENEAVTYFIHKIYETNPLVIENGSFKLKNDSKFTDLAKSYLMAVGLVNRINKVPNCESKIIEPGKSNSIFVILDNDTALEYLSPTMQHPDGQLTIFDLDEDTTIETSQNFKFVNDILDLSKYIRDLPDEENIPKRRFYGYSHCRKNYDESEDGDEE